jgi:AraC-like DNA-binding protein
MAGEESEFRLMRFSTEELSPDDRFDIWRETLTGKLMRLAVDVLGDRPFFAKAALRALPSLKIGIGVVSPMIQHRTREIARQENDDVALLTNLQGPLLIRREGVDIQLAPGDAVLVDCSDVGDYIIPDTGRCMVVRMKRSLLGAFSKHVDPALGQLVPAQTEALKMLVTYARSLPQGEYELSPAATQVMTDHVSDLVSLIVGASGDAAAIASGRGLAAARLGAAKTHIRERVGWLELSAETVAGEQGISPRYLRQLFEAEGQSFSGYVLEQRLSQAHAMLASPRFAASAISQIAFDVGFGDLSYFNRVFRRRYDRTPRDVRADAMRAWQNNEPAPKAAASNQASGR